MSIERRFQIWWLAFVIIVGMGCDATYRQPSPGPRATSSAVAFRRADRETFWVVTVNNPTNDSVYLDCEELRIRIPPRVQTDILLSPEDAQCDLKNDVEYGARPYPWRTASWGHARSWGCGP